MTIQPLKPAILPGVPWLRVSTCLVGDVGSRIVLAGVVAVYLILSHWPHVSTEVLGPDTHRDKLIHMGAYFFITWLTIVSLSTRRGGAWRFAARSFTHPVLFALLILFACLDEMTQPWFGRHQDPLDLMADSVGIGSALAISYLVYGRKLANVRAVNRSGD